MTYTRGDKLFIAWLIVGPLVLGILPLVVWQCA
jgi:hypothetical protein